MSELNQEELEIIQDILGAEEDDPIFGGAQPTAPIPGIPPRPPKLVSSPRMEPLRIIQHHQRSNTRIGGGSTTKCSSICLGGADLQDGMTSDANGPHFCTSLGCISCDHQVIRFKDCRWSKSTDYLFLRNNYPDTVKSNLVRAPGWCAYCCQCTFCEERETRKLAPFSSNWVCRGHSRNNVT